MAAYLISAPKKTITMLHHYFVLILRSFKRNRSSFFINLIGLSTGLACALLIYLWVYDELSIDAFHEQGDRLYQVMSNSDQADGINTWNGTTANLAEALIEDIPEVELAVGATDPAWQMQFELKAGDDKHAAVGKFVDEGYFDLFSYPLIEGGEEGSLTDKAAIMISAPLALKLFNTLDNLIGKTIEWQLQGIKSQSVISGVFTAPPSESTDQFDFVLPFSFYRYAFGESWEIPNAVTYVLLHDQAKLELVNEKIRDIHQQKVATSGITYFLQAYPDIYLYGQYENGRASGGRIDYVNLFSIIAIFLLGIACINFVNLSTARATRRGREVGVKKVIGAGRGVLIGQYLGEALLMSFCALLVGMVLARLFLPTFNAISGKTITMSFDPFFMGSVLTITILTGLLSGLYPAFYLANFDPIKVLKGKMKGSLGELWLRKGLVIFQFSLSLILIVGVLVLFKQVTFIQDKNLGYERDNLIRFDIQGQVATKLETFLKEVKKLNGVADASAITNDFFSPPGAGDFQWEGQVDNDIQFGRYLVDYGFIETMGVELVAGRSFSRDFTETASQIILNESASKAMGLADPIGKRAKLSGQEVTIVGVVKDFHFRSLHDRIGPMFFHLSRDFLTNVVLRIEEGEEQETLATIKEYYEAFNPGIAFDYQFIDEDYQALYQSEQRVASLSRYFAGMAILISCLGIFGLASFMGEQRKKEIGIRKILGSSVWQVVGLLAKDFTFMVLVAIVMALPLSYWMAQEWLSHFAYRIELEWWFFGLAGAMCLGFTWLTVGRETWKAARLNPVISLKSE